MSAGERRPQRENESQRVFDVVQGFGSDCAETLHQSGPGDRAQASDHRDAVGVDALIRGNARPQRSPGAGTRHRNDNDQLVFDFGEHLVGGHNNRGSALAGFTRAGSAEGDQPQLSPPRLSQYRRLPRLPSPLLLRGRSGRPLRRG